MSHFLTGEEAIEARGAWTHASVSANAARFHYVTQGDGPLLLLLHGFGQYWWTWRNFLGALASQGYRVVALDIRGYGNSDHTPRGYDPYTLSQDIAGVIGSLGEREATIIGHDVGGLLGFSTAALHPKVVNGLVAISSPHPLRLRQAWARSRAQRQANDYVFRYQAPIFPERLLHKGRGMFAETFIRDRSYDGSWVTDEVGEHFRAAFDTPHTPHCALEFYRWQVRSLIRPDGRKYNDELAHKLIAAPVLHLRGDQDTTILPATFAASEAYVHGPYASRSIPNAGFFPHEEEPQLVLDAISKWLLAGRTWDDRAPKPADSPS